MLKYTKMKRIVVDGVPVIGIKFRETPSFDTCEWCFCSSRSLTFPNTYQPKGLCGSTNCHGIDLYIPVSMFDKTIAKLEKLEQNEST